MATVARFSTPENLDFLLDSGLTDFSPNTHNLSIGFFSSITELRFDNASIFLKRGAGINHQFTGQRRTRLFLEILPEKVDAVKFLIDNNADVNLVTSEDGSPLLLAVHKDNVEIIELLMRSERVKFTIINNKKFSPVNVAISLGKLKALAAILDNGFSNDYYTIEGYSLLQFAALDGSLETLKFLINSGFKFITYTGTVSYALHLATRRSKTETVKFLLEYGADPYEPMIPVTVGSVKRLFPRYASRIVQSDPAIILAILQGDFDCFKVFLDAGMNPNSRIFGSTCSILHLVCEEGNVQMAAYLITMGADTRTRDSSRKSPFDYTTKDFTNQVFNY